MARRRENSRRLRIEQTRDAFFAERSDIDAAAGGAALTVIEEMTAVAEELGKTMAGELRLDLGHRLHGAAVGRHAEDAGGRSGREDGHVVVIRRRTRPGG